ncbi:MAG: hypothetical protein R2711_02330 [Acidimicrobiales bacterium]
MVPMALHRLVHHRRHRFGHLGAQLAQRARIAVEAGEGGGRVGLAHEGRLAGEGLVEDDPQRVEVGAPVDGTVLDLFGREVLGGADHGAHGGEVARFGRLGDAEVGHQDPPVGRQQDVGRLDVAVHQAGGVGGAEGVGHLGADREHGGQPHRAVLVEVGAHGGARHELHHDGLEAVLAAGVVHRDDRGVRQPGGGDRLGPEALDERRVARQVRVEHLHRDPAGEELVERLPHLGHAARRDRPLQPIAAGEQAPGQRVAVGPGGGRGGERHGPSTLPGGPEARPGGRGLRRGCAR